MTAVDDSGSGVLCEWRSFDVEVLVSLYRHQLLTTGQVHVLHGPDYQVRWIQKTLKRLESAGAVGRVVGRPPGREARWFCTASGVAVAESTGDVVAHRFRMDALRAVSGGRGLLAVNDVGVALSEAARRFGDGFSSSSWEHQVGHVYGPGKDLLVPDAVISYDRVNDDGGVLAERRFIEIDRGGLQVHDLVDKMYAYNQFLEWAPKKTEATGHLARLGWKRMYSVFPGVVFVFDGLDAKKAKDRATHLAGFLASDTRFANRVNAVATTVDALRTKGPFEPICVDLRTGDPAPLFN